MAVGVPSTVIGTSQSKTCRARVRIGPNRVGRDRAHPLNAMVVPFVRAPRPSDPPPDRSRLGIGALGNPTSSVPVGVQVDRGRAEVSVDAVRREAQVRLAVVAEDDDLATRAVSSSSRSSASSTRSSRPRAGGVTLSIVEVSRSRGRLRHAPTPAAGSASQSSGDERRARVRMPLQWCPRANALALAYELVSQ